MIIETKNVLDKLIKLIFILIITALIFSMSGCSKNVENPSVISEPEEMTFAEFQWPDTEIAKLMPVPKSTIGNIAWSKDYGFVIYVAETSLSDYAAYVQECEALGFILDCRKGDDYFYANNADGYHVSVTFKDNDVMFVRIDEPKESNTEIVSEEAETSPEPTEDEATSTTSPTEDSEPIDTTEPEPVSTPETTEKTVYYSTNTFDRAEDGNTGIFAYKRNGTNYDFYWIIDFDEGCAYWFTYGNNSSICERVQIDEGDLNTLITVTYHDGDSTWQYGLCFKRVRQPDHLIQSEANGTQYEFIATDLEEALKLRDDMEIVDY